MAKLMARDPNDFSEATKKKVLKRAGYECSYPNCNLKLIGPHSDAEGKGTISTSEVSHIQGARPAENNRFNTNMPPEERSHHSNAIALCRTHAKLIDSDEDTYHVGLLHEWKKSHEEKIRKMQAGEFVPDDYIDKPYDKCTNEELVEDRAYRYQLLKEERQRKRNYCKKVARLPIFTTLALLVWYFLEGGVSFLMLFVGLIFIVGPVKSIIDILEKDNKFEIRQKLSIEEINFRLKDRGVE
jgi:hypothetical protein